MMRRAATLAVLALLLALITQLPALLAPPEASTQILQAKACDLNSRACSAEGDGVQLTFALTPRPIRPAQPLMAELRLSGIQASKVRLSLEGRDMYMGINQIELKAGNEPGQWVGNTSLAVCTTGRMVWRAHLIIEQGNRTLTTAFDFEAG